MHDIRVNHLTRDRVGNFVTHAFSIAEVPPVLREVKRGKGSHSGELGSRRSSVELVDSSAVEDQPDPGVLLCNEEGGDEALRPVAPLDEAGLVELADELAAESA